MTTFKFYFVCSLGTMILKQTYPEWTLFGRGIRTLGNLKKIIEENEARFGLL